MRMTTHSYIEKGNGSPRRASLPDYDSGQGDLQYFGTCPSRIRVSSHHFRRSSLSNPASAAKHGQFRFGRNDGPSQRGGFYAGRWAEARGLVFSWSSRRANHYFVPRLPVTAFSDPYAGSIAA